MVVDVDSIMMFRFQISFVLVVEKRYVLPGIRIFLEFEITNYCNFLFYSQVDCPKHPF